MTGNVVEMLRKPESVNPDADFYWTEGLRILVHCPGDLQEKRRIILSALHSVDERLALVAPSKGL